ncbi:MAG: molybdopterin oxidoreductase [Oxalobacteraceae bacterium]|nr:MAG: molybdopterin oxidoreductase [Oxalobacteraceae bacterium]
MTNRRRFLAQFAASSAAAAGGFRPSNLWAQQNDFGTGRIVHRSFPLNSEPRPYALAAGFITPQSDFYIRNHGTVPELRAQGYGVRLEMPGTAPVTLTLDDLRSRFERRTITAVMQCAGNRRADMGKYKSVSGDAWQAGSISNAVWGGVGLGDVLRAAGVRDAGDLHVAFAGHDDIEEEGEKFKFGVSIPLAKAMALETLIAFDMNGEVLTPAHGFPVRMVVPGYAGVRSPKWLASIKVQDKPSDNHIQQKEYRLFSPDVTSQTADPSKAPFINDMPLNSAILLPSEGAAIASGTATLRGFAIATSERVSRVEVSADGGSTWTQAMLDSRPDTPWSWTPWTADVRLRKGRHQLVVRAFGSNGGSQPATPAPIWNYPGYLSRSWHRVHVDAV